MVKNKITKSIKKNKEEDDDDSLDSSRGENESVSAGKENLDFDDDMKLEDDEDILDVFFSFKDLKSKEEDVACVQLDWN